MLHLYKFEQSDIEVFLGVLYPFVYIAAPKYVQIRVDAIIVFEIAF